MDAITLPPENSTTCEDWQSAFEVVHLLDRLLVRVIGEHEDASGESLWAWLNTRRAIQERFGECAGTELREALTSHPTVLARIADAAITGLTVDDHRWGYVHRLWRATQSALTDELFLSRLLSVLDEQPTEKKAFLYELALVLTFRIGPSALSVFEHLYSYAESGSLLLVRDRCCFDEISDWRREDAQRRHAHAIERETVRARNRNEFDSVRDQLRNESRHGWLHWIAAVYFALFRDVNNESTSRARLTTELGEDNASAATDVLIAFVRRGEITDLQTVSRMAITGHSYPWWYAVIAGLDEYVNAGHTTIALSDAYLQSALAIDCIRPTHRHEGNTTYVIDHLWKREVLRARPDLARDAYLALTRAGLAEQKDYVYGLHELMHVDQLQAFRQETALSLLREFGILKPNTLRELLSIATSGDSEELAELARTRAAESNAESNHDCHSLWIAAGFLVCSAEFRNWIQTTDSDTRKSFLWAVRDLSGSRRSAQRQSPPLAVDQLELLAEVGATEFAKADHPTGGWSGDTNPWDAADLVRSYINLLAANPSSGAAEALARLEAKPGLASYSDDIKHARAQQHVRSVDSQYEQPNWHEVVAALSNGTPANVADLHALLLAHLEDLKVWIASSNTDIYKHFWNEDGRARILTPKSEDSCRDVLVDLLRVRLSPCGVLAEPEGHMSGNRRADIVAGLSGMKVVVELKRDYHADVWTAAQRQLDRFYTRDPEARGFGIYGVFWFGDRRPSNIPPAPPPLSAPRSAEEMRHHLQSLVPADRSNKVQVVVIDVSGN